MRFNIREFSTGFLAGFGSGVAYRTLANRDIAAVREAFKNSTGVTRIFGEVVLETLNRIRRNKIEDGKTEEAETQASTAEASAAVETNGHAKPKRARPPRKTSRQRRDQRRSQKPKSTGHGRSVEHNA